MSTELTTETRETGTRDRGPLTWLVAAAAAVVIAGAGLFAVLHQGGGSTDAPPVAGGPARTVTELGAPDAAAYGRCMVPTADALAQREVAVDATVSQVVGDKITLTPTHWYAGTPTDLVRVDATRGDLQQLLGAVDFQQGGRYLVSATDGQVSVCGFSGAYSDDLAALYEKAFG
jgi:hypothetical protein